MKNTDYGRKLAVDLRTKFFAQVDVSTSLTADQKAAVDETFQQLGDANQACAMLLTTYKCLGEKDKDALASALHDSIQGSCSKGTASNPYRGRWLGTWSGLDESRHEVGVGGKVDLIVSDDGAVQGNVTGTIAIRPGLELKGSLSGQAQSGGTFDGTYQFPQLSAQVIPISGTLAFEDSESVRIAHGKFRSPTTYQNQRVQTPMPYDSIDLVAKRVPLSDPTTQPTSPSSPPPATSSATPATTAPR